MGSAAKLSKNFENLLAVARSFEHVPVHTAGKGHVVRLAEALGPTAVPLLIRKLREGSDPAATWAEYLLARSGSERAVAALRALCDDASVAPDRRRAALGLLAELGAPVRAPIRPLDAGGIDALQAEALLADIADRGDAAHAADHLVTCVDPVDVVPVCRRLAAAHGAATAPLLDELAVRDDLWSGATRQLGELRARLGPTTAVPAPPGEVYAGGPTVVAVRRGRSGRRRRTLVVQLTREGGLARVLYDGDG